MNELTPVQKAMWGLFSIGAIFPVVLGSGAENTLVRAAVVAQSVSLLTLLVMRWRIAALRGSVIPVALALLLVATSIFGWLAGVHLQ